jgi:hypothetical protein
VVSFGIHRAIRGGRIFNKMRLKELDRTAAVVWSPCAYYQDQRLCPLLATGSVAGALDLSFSSNTELEIFALDLQSGKKADGLKRIGVAPSVARYSSLGRLVSTFLLTCCGWIFCKVQPFGLEFIWRGI